MASAAPPPFVIDAAFLLLGEATTFAIAVGKGAFGGGLALLGVPLLSLVVTPIEATILIAPLVAFTDLFALGAFGPSSWSRPDLGWLLPGLAIGAGAGMLVVLLVDARIVSLVIAGVTLAFTAHYFLKGRRAPPAAHPVSRPLAVIAGAASGFTTFVAHAGGPPVAMYLLRRGLSKTLFVGTTVAFFALGNFVKLPTYVSLGLGRPGLLPACLWLAPAVPLGVYVGKRLHDALPRDRLFTWCYAILAVAAGKLLVDAARALLA